MKVIKQSKVKHIEILKQNEREAEELRLKKLAEKNRPKSNIESLLEMSD